MPPKKTTNKFNKNLFEASENKTNIEETKKEWEIINEEKRKDLDRLCICQHKIKNVIYLYNKHTKNIINCGVECVKKFQMENNEKMKKGMMREVLSKVLREKKTEDEKYEMRWSLEKYLPDVKMNLINLIDRELSTSKYDMDKLGELRIKIKELIEEYRITYLDDVLVNIMDTIQELKEKKEEERRRELIRLKEFEEKRMKEIEFRKMNEKKVFESKMKNEKEDKNDIKPTEYIEANKPFISYHPSSSGYLFKDKSDLLTKELKNLQISLTEKKMDLQKVKKENVYIPKTESTWNGYGYLWKGDSTITVSSTELYFKQFRTYKSSSLLELEVEIEEEIKKVELQIEDKMKYMNLVK